MNQHKLKPSLRSLFAIAILLIVASCHKDHDKIAGPAIGDDPNGGKDTITVGATVILKPAVTSAASSSFAWTLDGKNVSADSTYTFTPSARGDYSISVTVSNSGGNASQKYDIHVYGAYENGFFLANEGWYGHGGGTLGFYRYDTQQLEDSVYEKANPGKDLGPNTSSLEFGSVFNNKVYLTTKAGGPLVQLDAYSLKESGRIATADGNDFRVLLPIDTTLALLGTGDGIVRLNLQTMVVGSPVAGISGETGDMLVTGNYIFVLTANDGLDILNRNDYTIAKTIPGIVVGLTKSMDGKVFAAGADSTLVQIDPATLDTTLTHLPFDVNGTFGFWHPGSITASTKENAVYIAANGPYSGATAIYKYTVGGDGVAATPFISIAVGKELYGSGISYDAVKDRLVVSTVESGYGTHYAVNDLLFFSAADGSLIKDDAYNGYYFPAMSFYH